MPTCWGKYIPYKPPDTCATSPNWCCVGKYCGQETKCCGNDTCKMYSKYSGKCVGNSVEPDNACDKLGCPNNNQKYNDKWW